MMLRNVLRGVLAVSVALGLVGVGVAANAVPAPTSAVLTPASGPLTGGTEVVVEAPAGVTFTQVSGGYRHSVALASDGTAYAWGHNKHGSLGNGLNVDSNIPVPVKMPRNVTFKQVGAGDSHSIALASDGTVYTWGYNFGGQLGTGGSGSSNMPVKVQTPEDVEFTQVSAGGWHSVALAKNGTAYAWGYNSYGQLGDGTEFNKNKPVRVQTDVPFTQVSAGGVHMMGLAKDGTVYSWGYNKYGQLGDGSDSKSDVPVSVNMPPGVTFTQVSAGGFHSTALAEDGTAYAWGSNRYGELGHHPTSGNSDVPVLVEMTSEARFTHVSAGEGFSMAIASNDIVYAWGNGTSGQLAGGELYESSYVPMPVFAPSGVMFTEMSAGGLHSTALTEDGTAYAWGSNEYGQLGDEGKANMKVPVPVLTRVAVTGVSFDGTSGNDLVDNGDGSWTVTTPPHDAGPVDVVVSWALNEVAQPDITYAGAFTYVVPDVAPTVTDPVDQAVTAGDAATFTVETTGTPEPTLMWEISMDDGATWDAVAAADGTVSGDGRTLTVVATEAQSGFQYRATATNSAGTEPSAAATLMVSAAPVAPTVTDPVDQTVTAGDAATFTVETTGTPEPTLMWEISADDGATWDAVAAADGTVSGDGKTLTVVATEALSGVQYRATATNSAGTEPSAAATLTVPAVIGDEGHGGGLSEKDLARTGSHAAPFIAAAVLLMLAGAGLALASRRKHA